jgi:hypothetical protein
MHVKVMMAVNVIEGQPRGAKAGELRPYFCLQLRAQVAPEEVAHSSFHGIAAELSVGINQAGNL